MDDLLKEAIADAKAVRETALANAKMALEEAFTPRLKSMLAKKIQHEIEEEDEVSDEDAPEISDEDEEAPVEEPAPEVEEAEEVSDEDEEEVPTEVVEIDGVKYAPVVSEEEEEPTSLTLPMDGFAEALNNINQRLE